MCGKGLAGKGRGLFWVRGMLWESARQRASGNVPKKYGSQGELFFFVIDKHPVVFREMVGIGHCIPAKTITACAMCGLSMLAEEHASLPSASIAGGGGHERGLPAGRGRKGQQSTSMMSWSQSMLRCDEGQNEAWTDKGPKCDKEAGAQIVSLPVLEGGQKTKSKEHAGHMGANGQDIEEILEVTKRNEGQWKKSHLTVRRWASEKEAGACQLKAFGNMSLLKALCWEFRADGTRVGGQWCSLIMVRRWGRRAGCTERWMQS